MQIIKKLNDRIGEELHDAKHYVECALKHKDERRGLADTLYSISVDEMRHMSLLHAEVVKIIEEYRKTNGEPPASMQAVYDYLHEQHIKEAAEIKMMQQMYKEG